MGNAFYAEFDTDHISENNNRSDADYRSPFQVDRDRIVFSFAFRRLQSKTQVFQSGEYDFYRTRLTHSIEVAKLGRSICDFLRLHPENDLHSNYFIDPALTEAICLAHDLGHPPFGHIGERKLNELMAEYGGFEGNAQTARILNQLIYRRPEGPVGMNPTRALMDGVMKYKVLYSEYQESIEDNYPENHFIYDNQYQLRQTILDPEAQIPFPVDRLKLNQWKSIECQIMDWADDTAYSLNDIADGIQAGYINLESLTSWKENQTNLAREDHTFLEELETSITQQSYERRLSYKIGRFIQAVRLGEQKHPLNKFTHRHAYQLIIDPAILRECQLYKTIAYDLIFQSPQIQQVEYKGSFILEKLFGALLDHYLGSRSRTLKIIPAPYGDWIRRERKTAIQARLICDYLAGLTDGEAVRLYRRLFDPDYGSITDLA